MSADEEDVPSDDAASDHNGPTLADASLSQLNPPMTNSDHQDSARSAAVTEDIHTDDDFDDPNHAHSAADNAIDNPDDPRHRRSGTTVHRDESASEPDSASDDDEARDHYDESSAMVGFHARKGSMADQREQLRKDKEAMERKLRSLSQNFDQKLDTALDEYSEMEKMNEDRVVFSDLFDRIDPNDNGDVDEKEWITGLQRLGVDITEPDMKKLFSLMDGDKSGYIDRQDWITFCMSHYESKELQRLHDSVLANVKGHSRKPSNMFNPAEANAWSSVQQRQLEAQMTQAFIEQGQVEVAHAEEEEEYMNEMKREEEENPNWAKPERALEWTPKEVAFWLDSIELTQYARAFDEEQVDGSILLNDCDRALLSGEMGIKALHVGKILREVDKLRKVNKLEMGGAYKDWNELQRDNEEMLRVMQTQTERIKELEIENQSLKLKAMMGGVGGGGDVIEVPVAADETDGLNLNLEDGGNAETTRKMKGNGGDLEAMVQRMEREIEHLHREKIVFAENAATEIEKLNRIVGALSTEYTVLATPYYKKFNPVDSLIRSLGYMPTQK